MRKKSEEDKLLQNKIRSLWLSVQGVYIVRLLGKDVYFRITNKQERNI